MVRLTAIFVAVCMALIAVSVGVVLYFMFGFSGAEASMVSLTALTAMAIYNTLTTRVRDRSDVGGQIADLSRGTADLARQVAEIGRRVIALESRFDTVAGEVNTATAPLVAEIGELGTLVTRLAETVAAHETAIAGTRAGVAAAPAAARPTAIAGANGTAPSPAAATPVPMSPAPVAPVAVQPAATAHAAMAQVPVTPATAAPAAFAGLSDAAIREQIRKAIDANRVDLYLQPIVTLPQRKVRYYEALSRLKLENGTIVNAADFVAHAEHAGLMPQLDNLLIFRCVQVVRRLLLKNREVGLFCNISAATLSSPQFPAILEFMEANRAIAPSLIFELTQHAVRHLGPMEQESMAALGERGFRFSIDNVSDLRIEPRDLSERGFRYIKVPASLLLDRSLLKSDIHPADLSDLVGRFAMDLIAEKIETESMVVDLLDYDVRFGQGLLFSPPRPVRAEALQGVADRDLTARDVTPAEPETRRDAEPRDKPVTVSAGVRTGGLAALARGVVGRN